MAFERLRKKTFSAQIICSGLRRTSSIWVAVPPTSLLAFSTSHELDYPELRARRDDERGARVCASGVCCQVKLMSCKCVIARLRKKRRNKIEILNFCVSTTKRYCRCLGEHCFDRVSRCVKCDEHGYPRSARRRLSVCDGVATDLDSS